MNQIFESDDIFSLDTVLFNSIKNAYEMHGYILIRNFLNPETVSSMKKEIDRLIYEQPNLVTFENSVIQGSHKVIHKISHFTEKSRVFSSLALDSVLLNILKHILEEEALLCTDKINFKQPGGRGFYPHQDMSGMWKKYLSNIITAFIAIDEADKENGCLEIASGWHRSGMLGPYMSPISQEYLGSISFNPIPLHPGDMIVFDGYAPHQSAPNFSTRSRRSILFTYNRKSEGHIRYKYLKDVMT